MKCPCKECIKFAICYNNIEVECSDLLSYMCKGRGPLMYDPDRLRIVELTFKTPIVGIISLMDMVTFKERGSNI